MADHWYDEEGTFREDITDLKKARAGGSAFFVGASSIAKRLPAPHLTKWLQTEAAKAAVGVRRLADETEQQWANRAVEQSLKQVQEAADTGTEFHELAEAVLHGESWHPVAGLHKSSADLAALLRPWAGALETEVSLPPYFGVGGRCDGFEPSWLLDYKSQNVKDGKKADFWPTYIIQKCIYREALRMWRGILPRPVTIVVSRNPNNQGVWVKEWDDDEIREATIQGHILTMSWLLERNYRLDKLPVIMKRLEELVSEIPA